MYGLPPQEQDRLAGPLVEFDTNVLKTCKFSDFRKEVEMQAAGRIPLDEIEGVSTGWRGLDEIYKPVRGELTVLTGTPGSGKSEFLLEVAVRCADRHDWKIGLCTLEGRADEVMYQLLEKKSARNKDELSPEDLKELYRNFYQPNFRKIAADFKELSMHQILQRAQYAVDQEGGLDALLIDPYNYIKRHDGAEFLAETEFVTEFLSKLKAFAQRNKCHVWLVVHPCKRAAWASSNQNKRPSKTGKPDNRPTLYDIAGSAHFYNKCDMGLIVQRDPECGKMTVHVDKVRNRDAGKIGSADFWFDRRTRCFMEGMQTLEKMFVM